MENKRYKKEQDINLTKEEYSNYIKQLKKIKTRHDIILCPNMLNISAKKRLKNIILGSQNVSAYKKGAHTGEVTAKQLASYDVKYSLIAHSERRIEQKEEDKEFLNKINNCLEEQIIPIYCIGETKEQKDSKKTKSVLLSELNECLSGINNNDIIIAYEPIWAIGTGITPTKDEVEDVLKEIKKVYQKNKLKYGGSLNQENIVEFKTSYLIDGYLLGGLSLKPQELKDFISKIED